MQASSAAAAAVPMLGPRILHPDPLETLNVACVGVGGMGRSDLNATAKGDNVRIVALCDIDANNLGGAAKGHEGAKTFRDYRKMFDAMGKDIDAVVVATPDHMHGSISLAALDRRPLSVGDQHSIHAKCGGHRHDQDGGAVAALLEYEELHHKLR